MFVRTVVSRRTESSLSGALTVALLPMLAILLAIGIASTDANPLNNLGNGYALNRKQNSLTVEIAEPEELVNSLGALLQQIFDSMDYNRQLAFIQKGTDKKRGIDLGLSRGFSGSQAAKHLMGMQAASFANGPGRKRK